MLGGKGFYRGSSVLVSGTAGTGKTSIAAQFADAACARGERCLYFAFEESPSQIVRNMRSIGIDLQRWVRQGLLTIQADASHRLRPGDAPRRDAQAWLMAFRPGRWSMDPITQPAAAAADPREAKWMLVRLIDFLKARGITGCLTSLTGERRRPGGRPTSASRRSSTPGWWSGDRSAGERNRGLYILKSRGMVTRIRSGSSC